LKTEMDNNRGTYESRTVVGFYANYSGLQQPERMILEELKPKLGTMRMLDIGVGTGRTTAFFSPFVKEYVAIDYSQGMVDAFRRKHNHNETIADSIVCDGRSMDVFEDNYFDFILFSFNGIDYVNYEDRLIILKEVRRVGTDGGFFCFSSHNLQGISSLYRIKPTLNPYLISLRLLFFFRILLLNGMPWSLKAKDVAFLNDGAHNFRLTTCYIKPIAQIKQLEENGFKDVRLFPLHAIFERSDRRLLEGIVDPWIYYLCKLSSK